MSARVRPVAFDSAEIEPFAARIIGLAASQFCRLKEREKETGEKPDRFDMEEALMHLWWALKGLDHIAIALRGGRDCDDVSGVHFGMVMNAEHARIHRLVMEELGIDPATHPQWK